MTAFLADLKTPSQNDDHRLIIAAMGLAAAIVKLLTVHWPF